MSAARQRPCPICSRPADASSGPFCSRRCADVDLQRWLSDRYAVPAVENEEGAENEPSEEG